MKIMYPPGYHYNVFVTTYALEHMTYDYTLLASTIQRLLKKGSKEHNVSGQK